MAQTKYYKSQNGLVFNAAQYQLFRENAEKSVARVDAANLFELNENLTRVSQTTDSVVYTYAFSLQPKKNSDQSQLSSGFTQTVNAYSTEIIGDKLPRARLHLMNGDRVNFRKLKGKVTVVLVYALQCSPCDKVLPFIKTMQTEYGEDLAVYLVTPNSQKELRTLAANTTIHVCYGARRYITQSLKKSSYPQIFVLNKQGRIENVWRHGPGRRIDYTGKWVMEKHWLSFENELYRLLNTK